MTARSAERRQDGYSLVEVVVATGIFGAAIVPIMLLFTQSLRVVDRADQMSALNNAARSLLEEVASKSWEDVEVAEQYPGTRSWGIETTAAYPGVGYEVPYNNYTFDDVDDYCGWTQIATVTSEANDWDIHLIARAWYVPEGDTDGSSDTDGDASNDNGVIALDLSSGVPANPCGNPGTCSRFKKVQVTATSRKYPTGDPRNASPVVMSTVRFKDISCP